MPEGKIKGSRQLIELVEKATPWDTNIHVNIEALRELPEQFCAQLTRVHFDPANLEDNFTEISGKWMPKTDLMYDIAKARGVRGSTFFKAEDVYQEVNVNPMYMKGYEDQPTMRNMHTGCSSTKQAIVTQDDGTEFTGAPCTVVDSFWTECLQAWSKEEEETEGYSKVIDGPYKIKEYGRFKDKTGPHYKNSKGWIMELKYNTKWRRIAHYESQKSLSQNMAQTKSWLKCIREQAGLKTAYNAKDLKSGQLIFSKIIKSSESLKMESLTHLSAIKNGNNSTEDADMLFGEKEKNVTPEKSPVNELIEFMDKNKDHDKVPENLKTTANQIYDWLKRTPDADQSEYWDGAIKVRIEMMEAINDKA